MSVQFGDSVPGIRTARTYQPRNILWGDSDHAGSAKYIPGGVVISGADSRDAQNTGDVITLRPGLLMGKLTSGGKYAPAVLGVNSVAYTSGATGLTLSAATATELLRRVGASGTLVLTGPPTAAGTVTSQAMTFSAVNTTTGVVTVSTGAANTVVSSLVQSNTDGTSTIRGILDEHYRVTDADGTALDVQGAKILYSAPVVASQIINYPASSSLITWLKDQLNQPKTAPGPFTFDDNF